MTVQPKGNECICRKGFHHIDCPIHHQDFIDTKEIFRQIHSRSVK